MRGIFSKIHYVISESGIALRISSHEPLEVHFKK